MITGIIAFILFLLAGMIGLLRINFILHKSIALVAVAFAIFHVGLLTYFKTRR
jgi:hypothetical protein